MSGDGVVGGLRNIVGCKSAERYAELRVLYSLRSEGRRFLTPGQEVLNAESIGSRICARFIFSNLKYGCNGDSSKCR